MAPRDWPTALTVQIVEAIREARKTAGLTAAAVAQGCALRGLTGISTQSLKNLESGRKTSITVADLLVLADVLGIPPITLLFPVGSSATVEVLPGKEVSAWDALVWFTGEEPRHQPTPEGTAREILDVFRHHGDLMTAAMASMAMAKEQRRTADTTLDRHRKSKLWARVAGYEEHIVEDCKELRSFRTHMRERKLEPPVLPYELAFVDSTEEQYSPREEDT